MKITELLKDNANVNVTLSLSDLQEFAQELISGMGTPTEKSLAREDAADLMTIDEVCAYLQVTKPTLHRWNKQQYLTCLHIGSKVRYRREDVERLAK